MWFNFENELTDDQNGEIIRLLEETENVPYIEVSQTTYEFYFSRVVVQVRAGKLESILTTVPQNYRDWKYSPQDLAIENKILAVVSPIIMVLSLAFTGDEKSQRMAKRLGKVKVQLDD